MLGCGPCTTILNPFCLPRILVTVKLSSNHSELFSMTGDQNVNWTACQLRCISNTTTTHPAPKSCDNNFTYAEIVTSNDPNLGDLKCTGVPIATYESEPYGISSGLPSHTLCDLLHDHWTPISCYPDHCHNAAYGELNILCAAKTRIVAEAREIWNGRRGPF